jgi:4,5-DOPA dioxygenase extradiol
MTALPTLFVSHGAPNLVLHNSAARSFLEAYGEGLGAPKAILVVSAHFEARGPALSAGEHPDMIYDFGGFEPELRTLVYPAPGSPDLARRAAELLREAGLDPVLVERGYDHGTWVPLMLLNPSADIPVVQLSVDPGRGPDYHLALGQALAPLAEEGVLIVGSGAATHNLHEYFRGGYRSDSPTPDWVKAFGDWLSERIEAGATDDLVRYRDRAPYGAKNHPTEEHLLPLFVALGAAGEGAPAKRVHTSHEYGVLMMDCYRFG